MNPLPSQILERHWQKILKDTAIMNNNYKINTTHEEFRYAIYTSSKFYLKRAELPI